MKILIIQTARLGDIYLMWPALRALRRQQPQAEIHVLARETYRGALEGLTVVDRVHVLASKSIIGNLMQASDDESFLNSNSYKELSQFLDNLKNEQFDKIINMSFSPVSSEITHFLGGASAEIIGYTRQSDGYLAIPDAMSAYFYAQVGYDRPNRFHLAEIFASMCGLDLAPADWNCPQLPPLPEYLPSEYITLHVGGSEAHKTLSVSKWISILSQIRKLRPVKIVLIGSESEKMKAAQVEAAGGGEGGNSEIINLVGELKLLETMRVIQGSRCLVGPDSAPIHMAGLVATPVLNLSVGRVKYWETGPRSVGSIVLPAETETDLPSDVVADMIMRLLHNHRVPTGTIEAAPGTPSYTGSSSPQTDFEWNLTEAIYLGKDFPVPQEPLFLEGIRRLNEVNSFLIEQLSSIASQESLQKRAALLDRSEEIIETIAKLVPAVIPLVRWYMTEKIRIGPGSIQDIVVKNLETQNLLQGVLDIYKIDPEPAPASEQEL